MTHPSEEDEGGMMEKKRLIGIVIVVTFLLLTPFCYAQNDDFSDFDLGFADPPANGIYKRDDIAIKFIPPVGWKIQDNSFQEEYGRITFAPSSFSDIGTNLGISVLPMPLDMAAGGADALEFAKQEMDKDETVLEAEISIFADTKALTSISSISGMKTKQIQFYKDSKMFVITFLAEEENFDRLLPTIDESLKTFEINPADSGSESSQPIDLKGGYEKYLIAIHKMQDFAELKEFLTSEALAEMKPPPHLTDSQVKEGMQMIQMMSPRSLDKFDVKMVDGKAIFTAEGESSLGKTVIRGEMIQDKGIWKISSEDWSNENMGL